MGGSFEGPAPAEVVGRSLGGSDFADLLEEGGGVGEEDEPGGTSALGFPIVALVIS